MWLVSDLVGNPYDRFSHYEALTCEPRCEKTCHRGFPPGPTQTGLHSHTEDGYRLEISDLGRRGVVLSIIYVAKTKALISFTVTAKLICACVFAYAKSRFSHNAAHMISFKLEDAYSNALANAKRHLIGLNIMSSVACDWSK